MKKLLIAFVLALTLTACQTNPHPTYNQTVHTGYSTLISAHKLLQNLLTRDRITVEKAREINAKLTKYEKTLDKLSIVKDAEGLVELQRSLLKIETELRNDG